MQGTLRVKIVRARGCLGFQTARADRQGALRFGREKSIAEPEFQALTAPLDFVGMDAIYKLRGACTPLPTGVNIIKIGGFAKQSN